MSKSKNIIHPEADKADLEKKNSMDTEENEGLSTDRDLIEKSNTRDNSDESEKPMDDDSSPIS